MLFFFCFFASLAREGKKADYRDKGRGHNRRLRICPLDHLGKLWQFEFKRDIHSFSMVIDSFQWWRFRCFLAAKYNLLIFKFSFINKSWTFTSANKQSSWKSILQESQEKVSFSILICNIRQFTQLLNFWLSFPSFLLWKWNNNYSRVIQSKDFQKKTTTTCQFMAKNVL